MVTWANNWNGVNHPQTAPDTCAPPEYDERKDKKPLGAAEALKKLDFVADLSKPTASKIFNSPPAEFQPDGGWETAR